jgi:hypothetical protein
MADAPAVIVAPPGWYPDPGGERAWRRFDGDDWTDELIAYGEESTRPGRRVESVAAHRAMLRYGIVSWFAGAAIVVEAVVTRGSSPAGAGATAWLIGLGVAGALVGFLAVARATVSLGGPTGWAFVPFVNLVAWSWRAVAGASHPLSWSRGHRLTQRQLATLAAAEEAAVAAAFLLPLMWHDRSSAVVAVTTAELAALGTLVSLLWCRLALHDLAG